MDLTPTKLAKLPLGERLKTFGMSLIIPALVAGLGSTSPTAFIETASYVAAGAITLVLGWWSLKQMAATCPRCGKKLDKTSVTATDKNVRVECEECFEWLISDTGTLRAFAPTTDAAGKFTAPVFEAASWPQECAACAAPSTRHVEAKDRTVHAAALLVGKVGWSSASVKGIPVCDAHVEAIGLEIGQLGDVRFVFPDYAARGRYVARNKGMLPATIAK